MADDEGRWSARVCAMFMGGLAMAAGGCQPHGGHHDGGPLADAGVERPGDAAVADSGTADSGMADSGMADSGTADAGDGGVSDGGSGCAVAGAASGAPVVVSPANGSTLRATSVDFAWTPGATQYRLSVGTAPGAADLFQSPLLGAATTTVTASGLPLTGQPVFVDLESHGEGGCRITRTTYTAAVRKGLAVIADFADARLEDWTGPGFRTEADLRAQLDQMQQHWDFLSRGIEKTQWDITRVTLAQNLTADAFPGWIEYRQAVMALVEQQVAVADYDVNRDGLMDGVWIIASDNGSQFDYLIGGFADIDDAGTFVDAQDSGSVVQQLTGNFNHELGHALGLPDLYGTYTTLDHLTVMDTSYDLPPDDFCAFDRVKLGWAKPQVITESARNVVLRSANQFMDVVQVPLADPAESFLMEFRQTPASGYGSLGGPYDGLIVYHALEGATQNQNPPLLKVEPADGTSELGAPDMTDVFYPGNPAMKLPVVLRSYLGDAPVLQIDDVRRNGDTIEVDLEVLGGAQTPVNLLVNPGFEDGTAGWTTNAFQSDPALVTFALATPGRVSGHSVLIDAPVQPNDADWRQHADGLVPGTEYRLCGWVKGQNIVAQESPLAGGTIGVAGTFEQVSAGFGTFDWTRLCLSFTPIDTSADVGCRLGGFASTVTGELWCDDLSLAPVTPAF